VKKTKVNTRQAESETCCKMYGLRKYKQCSFNAEAQTRGVRNIAIIDSAEEIKKDKTSQRIQVCWRPTLALMCSVAFHEPTCVLQEPTQILSWPPTSQRVNEMFLYSQFLSCGKIRFRSKRKRRFETWLWRRCQ
jgi:hypothetical protein